MKLSARGYEPTLGTSSPNQSFLEFQSGSGKLIWWIAGLIQTTTMPKCNVLVSLLQVTIISPCLAINV